MKPRKKNITEFFKVLSSKTRIKLLRVLAKRGGKMTVNELSYFLDISQPATSQHLRGLKTKSLVLTEKEGNSVYYTLNMEMIDLFDELVDDFFDGLEVSRKGKVKKVKSRK